uniref:Protein kinase domain-containing protein n=1 Tax=viral metagenome TaxID=1070528 RepID=A0A6C0IVF4_9ZZZZ
MYDKIIHPITKKKIDINTKKGFNLLNSYIFYLKGGSSSENDAFFDLIANFQSDETRMLDQRATAPQNVHSIQKVLKPKITKPINYNVNLNKCHDKTSKLLGTGNYKSAYKTNCDTSLWKPESEFSESFTQEDCNNSAILLTQEKDKEFFKEIDIQKKFKNPKIYRYGKCLDDRKRNYKIEDLYDSDLFTWLEENMDDNLNIFLEEQKPLLNNFKEKFMTVLEQVKHLHQENLAHLDIKPENIMIKYNKSNNLINKMALSDYGLVKNVPYTGSLVGTPVYIDPAVPMDALFALTKKSDIYSLGITLLVSLTFNFGTFNLDPYNNIYEELDKLRKRCNTSNMSKQKWIKQKLLPYIAIPFMDNNQKFLDLIYNMVICPRSKRYKIQQVIDHPWFKKN